MKANARRSDRDPQSPGKSRLFPTPWYFNLLVAALLGAGFALFALTPAAENGNNRLYDLMLHLRPGVAEDPRIVLINIDDAAVRRQGQWPWQRSVVADGVWFLSELAPEALFLDFDYSDPSPTTVDAEGIDGDLAALVEGEFDSFLGNLGGLQQALAGGALPAPAAAPLLGDLQAQARASRRNIRSAVMETRVDNDAALAAAIAANGTVSLPLLLSPSATELSSELTRMARSSFALPGGPDWPNPKDAALFRGETLVPMIEALLEATAYAGFTNNEIDADGTTRSAHLYGSDGETVYGHLVVPLFHEIREVESLEVEPRRLTLGTPEGEIRIPRRRDGSVLINWPRSSYAESFRQLSYTRILDAQRLEEDLAFNLRQMEAAGYFSSDGNETAPLELLRIVETTRSDMVENRRWGLLSEYRELKRAYLGVVGSFLNGPAEEDMLGEIRDRRETGGLSEDQQRRLQELEQEVAGVFADTREIYTALSAQRSRLESALEGSIAFVGFTATSTTDLGVTPFESEYVNLGVHASLLNTLLSESFLEVAPEWVGAVLALIVPLLIGLLIRGRRPVHHAWIGFLVVAVAFFSVLLTFVFTGIFVPALSMLLGALVTLGVLTVVALVETERDKRWLHGAFEHYISAEFIEELVQDPTKLDLGGQEQVLTAMFTDVRHFTGIAEQLDPTELVGVLNRYLTRMSDVILDDGGTIDKYEGDAIVSFFGAPIPLSDHPRRACEAALRMKREEEELNSALLRDGVSPQPLHTRIGINTGPMLVGNLGTSRRMDYTIMGHQANVAARLESAGKLYGSWILVGEGTQQSVAEGFMFRSLDRVRLAGLQHPIRLYELLGHRGEETPILNEALETFEDGLRAYEAGEFAYAEDRFLQVRRLYPSDGPAALFADRCAIYKQEGPPLEEWDGISNLESK